MRQENYLRSSNPRVPAAEYPFHHCVKLQMRFCDIDMVGHLNNNVYFSFFDLGKSGYFSDVLDGPIDWHRIGVVVVNINCDFVAQTRFSEPIEVWTTVTHIGEKSLKMEQRIVNSETGEVKCVGRTIMSGFDATTGKSAPISRTWVEAMERYEGHPLQEKM